KNVYEKEGSVKGLWHGNRERLQDYRLLSHDAIESFIERRKSVDPEKVHREILESGVQAYPYYHPNYPFRLREISDPPMIIYMKGELEPHDLRHSCAIVGTRQPTAYGQRLAKEFARELSACGVAIVSGMAIGIDSLAHWGAIEGGGKTVAVLASGVDICYPSSNKPLYQKLLKGTHGAVISEFAPGTKPESWRFPARNRIISGLCQALVVIEAGESSGSLISAKLAFEQSREVFAVPGRIDSPASRGTNMLIQRNLAHLCHGYEHVMKELGWVKASPIREVPTVVELFGKERELYDLISAEPVHFDYLCEKADIPAPELSATLTMLELAGVITRHPGDWYSK
ncbi:MAG TPA: DNA-processing protein DprA, partial [Chroococcales cyanobacterium]